MKQCKNRRLMMTAIALTLTLCCWAQASRDRLYMDVVIGPNHSMNENTDGQMAKTSGLNNIGDAIGVGGQLGIGQEWNRVLGWHASLGYNSNKGRANFYTKDKELYSFFDVEAFGDLTLDVLDLLAPNRSGSRFNVKGFVGAGVLRTFAFDKLSLSYTNTYSTKPTTNFGLHGGLQMRYSFTPEMAIAVNLSLSAMQDKFSGVSHGYPWDGRLNAGIGLVWSLRKHHGGPAFSLAGEAPQEFTIVSAEPEMPRDYSFTPVPVYIEPEATVEKLRDYRGSAYIDYPVNETHIYPAFRNNPVELQKLRRSIDEVMLDTMATVQRIELHGYASPEGSYARNAQLAEGRALSVRTYLKDMFRMQDSLLTCSSTAEDWQGLRTYIDEGELGSKAEYLRIIDGTEDPDVRLERIRAVSKEDYTYLLEGIFPRLRRCDYTIAYVVRHFSLQEARRFMEVKPSSLSLREFYDVAQEYAQDDKDYARILQLAAAQYPEDEVANLNAASASLALGDMDKAKTYLEKAGNRPETIYTRGMMALLDKDYETGVNLLKTAASLGVKESQDLLDSF